MNPNIMIIIYKSNQNMNTPLYFFFVFFNTFCGDKCTTNKE